MCGAAAAYILHAATPLRLLVWPGTGCWGAEGSGPLTGCCCPAE
jgi:hypothetical protein